MQSKTAFNPVEGNIGFESVNAFMRLINHQNIPRHIGDFGKFIEFAAEKFWAF